MYMDYHLHTYYSGDSDYPMEALVQDAIGKGLEEICFTDHVDYGVKFDWVNAVDTLRPEEQHGGRFLNVNYAAYHKEIAELRNTYRGKITIREGMEFGVQSHTTAQFEKLFSSYPFDFIILSCHQAEDRELWTQDFQKHRTQKEYNERYYSELLQTISEYKNYSVLGHLDLIRRYDLAGEYPFSAVKDIVEAILKKAIYDGKGIEVNTSSVRYGLSGWMPSWDILHLYRDLGGEILSVGSDTHHPQHLGSHIRQAIGELRDAGFRYICTYDRMQPIFHKL